MSEDLTKKQPETDSETLTRILANIAKVQEGQGALSTDIRSLRQDIFSVLNNTLLDLHERLTRLELNNNPPNTQT